MKSPLASLPLASACRRAPRQAAAPAPRKPIAPRRGRSPAGPAASEPEVKHTVIEGETTRIDELRVRGVPQRIVVTTKGARPSYEIILGDGSRDLSDGANTGAAPPASASGASSGSEGLSSGRSMAVYTEVSFDEAAALIDRLGIGKLTALAPAAAASRTPTTSPTRRGRLRADPVRAPDRRRSCRSTCS